jgi:hypothetical protein
MNLLYGIFRRWRFLKNSGTTYKTTDDRRLTLDRHENFKSHVTIS